MAIVNPKPNSTIINRKLERLRSGRDRQMRREFMTHKELKRGKDVE